MRRLNTPGRSAPPLDEPTVLLLLLGMDAPVAALPRLMFTGDGNVSRAAALWRQHEDFLVREAKRRRIDRPQDADVGRPTFFGEYCCEMMTRFPERYGRG